jgi:hypothetical protein
MLTLFKNGDPLMTASRVIDGIEAGFKQIKEWNDSHRGEEKLRVYYSIIDYVSNPIIGDKVKELIDKYDIEFYLPDGEKYRMGKPVWGEWSVFICNKEYKSKYQSQKDWEKAMEENNKEQVKKNLSWAIKVGAIDKNQLNDDIEKILNTDDAAEKLASF